MKKKKSEQKKFAENPSDNQVGGPARNTTPARSRYSVSGGHSVAGGPARIATQSVAGGEEKNGEIKKQLAECQKLNEEYLDGWKRAKADFLNYRREETERISKLIKYGNEDLILKLLPVLDNLDVAEKELPEELKDDQWVEGILKTKNQIMSFLKNQGIEEIKSLKEKFNPSFHEAVEVVEKDNYEPGTVVGEIKKGYLFQGKVLRPAKVKISK